MQSPPDWKCQRCGSTERRSQRAPATRTSRSTGCAECHRRGANRRIPGLNHYETRIFRALLRDDFHDVHLTQPTFEYLHAFDTYLTATKTGIASGIDAAAQTKAEALERLTDRRT